MSKSRKSSRVWLLRFIVLLVLLLGISFFIFRQHPLSIKPVSYRQLPHWQQGEQNKTLAAFKISCKKFFSQPGGQNVGSQKFFLTASAWYPACHAAMRLKNPNAKRARAFFERWLQVYRVKKRWQPGLFTGYYLPVIQASRKRTGNYQLPLYGRPGDLVMVNLGAFDPKLTGIKISGRIKDGKLYPYGITRAQINKGALSKVAKVLFWTNNRVGRYFLQIQGSGYVQLKNGKQLLLGYAGENGFSSTIIGRVLVRRGLLKLKGISALKVRQWLYQHPQQAQQMLNANKGFVFFKILSTKSPLGTQGVELTPGYSLAVDHALIPLGAPIWITTRIANVKNPQTSQPFHRLMVAQDTGGAITNIHGDIFWGTGKRAETLASYQNYPGAFWLLLPRASRP